MADTELKQISSGPADVIVEVEEEAPLSKDDEENTGSDVDSSSNTNDNQAPQDSHRRKYTVDEITNAIKTGNLEAMRNWLSSLPQGDERKAELNTVKYEYRVEYDCTVLHIAAESNQVAIAKELLHEGADPNIKDAWGHNSLHIACIASHDVNITEMVELLIERDCNIDETDVDQYTPLLCAAKNNHMTAVRMLLEKGADLNKKTRGGENALHLVCQLSSDVDITEVVKLLIDRVSNIDETELIKKTALHYSAENNHTTAVRMLLQKGADPNKKDAAGRNALHLVCVVSSDVDITEMVELLIERVCNIDETDDDQCTPLQYAVHKNLTTAVRMLLQKGADPNKIDEDGWNALHWVCGASSDVNIEVVEQLIESNCRVNEQDKEGFQPIHYAARKGNNEVIDVLTKHVEGDPKVLEIALSNGYKYLVKQLIKTPKWPALMRRTFEISGKITTPFREMVKKMPDVAEEILNKCTMNQPEITNPDNEYYSVAFCYEFLEDARDKEQSNEDVEGNEDRQREINYWNTILGTRRQNYQTIWGPKGFKKETHPLAIMVQYKRLNLLNHPLVGSLLHHKWNKFGLLWYIINLLTYLVFLVSLTTFALIIENPKSQACLSVSVNMSSNYSENYCSISTSRVSFIYISALVVIILSLCRLVLEVLQFKIQLTRYLYDWNNWMETALYIFSIMSVCVFRNDCLCPLTWQWQIGVVAVFLGWMNLVVFISKFPSLGIYVLMFINIFKTFLKTLLLSILLIVSFGLTFYLTFTQPEILRSPFSTLGRSLLKIVTMTTGELDFDSIFRQDPAGGSDDAEEIPFPPISYMLWIVFIIIMPVLLNNMLVGLAVGDIGAIQNDAELEKLALQVEHVLNVEEFLPDKWRHNFTCGYKLVKPNTKYYSFSSVKETWQESASTIRRRISKCLSHLKNIFKWKCRFFLWGGERYDTRESVGKVLHPKEDETKNNTHKILHEVKDLKTSVAEQLPRITEAIPWQAEAIADLKVSLNDEMEKTQERNDKVLQEVGDLKISLHDEIKKAQEKNDEVIQVLQRSFHGELETAQRMNEKLVREVGDLKISLHEEMQKAQNSVDEMKQLLRQIVLKQGGTEVQ